MKVLFKRICKTGIAAFLVLILMLGGFAGSSAQAATASELAAQINAISGLTASVSANTVNVSGSADIDRTTLALNINPGVTVNWRAGLQASATAGTYALNLSGGGTFTLENATVQNSGAGGTVYVSGAISLNIGSGGLVESRLVQGSAITITSNVQNVVVNVNTGGIIRSLLGGYAINDGSGVEPTSTSNTAINVNGGTVEAATTSAIRSTGARSIVTVNSGLVTSSPAGNVSPVISMNHDPPPTPAINNIIINGGVVRTVNNGTLSYVIQTSQSIQINGGHIQAINGRAINLVGMNSVAEVRGGRVSTVNGTAISTATTTWDRVANARIIVNNGIVEATNTGNAIHITGVNNTVSIVNGQVLARSGHTIYTEGRVLGIPVTISGGFVYAWGSDIGGAIYNPSANLNQPIGGVAVAWNTTTGTGTAPYQQGETNHLAFLPSGANIYWEINPNSAATVDGIRVPSDGLGNTFFELDVEVMQQYFTLAINRRTAAGPVPPEFHIIRAGEVINISTAQEEDIDHGLMPVIYYPINGSVFSRWEPDRRLPVIPDASFGDVFSSNTTFTMPSRDATITATYSPRYLLHVSPGNINEAFRNVQYPRTPSYSTSYGYFAAGTVIGITSSQPSWYFEQYVVPAGGWRSTVPEYQGNISNPLQYSTTFLMPARQIAVFSGPGDLPRPPPLDTRITTEVISGGVILGTTTDAHYAEPQTISEPYLAGTNIEILAIPGPNQQFSHWRIVEGRGLFNNPFVEDTVFIMLGNEDIKIEAVFDTFYTLNVEGGTGSGTYQPGTVITIVAGLSQGERFNGWTSITPNAISAVADPSARLTTFTMPSNNVTLTATYVPAQFTVEAIGSTNPAPTPYNVGAEVTVTAAPPTEGMEFKEWIVVSGNVVIPAENLDDEALTFTMPAENVILFATYTTEDYVLIAIGSTTPYQIVEYGEMVTLTAVNRAGWTFVRWNIVLGHIPSISESDLASSPISFPMPAGNLTLEAIFEPIPFSITVHGGTSIPSPTAIVGESVEVTANQPPVGMRFAKWDISENIDISLLPESFIEQSSFVFTMPAGDVELSAIFVPEGHFAIIVRGGTSSHASAPPGVEVTVTANQPPEGMRFERWVIVFGSIDMTLLPQSALEQSPFTFIMPAGNITLQAIFTYADDTDDTSVAGAHNIPQTGDENPSMFYSLLLVGLTGIIGTALYLGVLKRRNSK